MSLRFRVGTTILVDIDSHFYEDSYGEGEGWRIRKVYNDEYAYFKINRVAPGRPCPYHLCGKYGDLGWVSPSAIIREVEVEYRNYY